MWRRGPSAYSLDCDHGGSSCHQATNDIAANAHERHLEILSRCCQSRLYLVKSNGSIQNTLNETLIHHEC